MVEVVADPRGGGVARPVGALLGVVFRLVGRLRGSGRRALHPTGRVLPAVLDRYGSRPDTGVPWLDDTGTDEVIVRLSRATGLPHPLPDVLGLALRVPLERGRHGDLLLSSTGLGRLTRFVLRPARGERVGYTSLFPYRAAGGPLLVAAIPASEEATTFVVAWARPTGRWHRFGVLRLLDPGTATDDPVAFQPVERPVPGLPSYRWAADLRRPPYAASRRARGVEERRRADA